MSHLMMFARALLPLLLTSIEISVDPGTKLAIGGITTLDRSKWFGGHWSPSQEWRPEDLAEFGSNGYRAHPGRGFDVSARMSQVVEDAGRPGHVDVASLLASCTTKNPAHSLWPVGDLDYITSSKTTQLYPNSCKGPGGKRPNGFMPGSHAATAEFFALFYQHCMEPTTRSRYLMEVANECEVKIYPSMCNTTWPEMIALHVAVADAVHAAHKNASTSSSSSSSSSSGGASLPQPLVCGPTAAFPEYQISDFKRWRADGTMAEFLAEAGGHIDCFSVHLYDQFAPATSNPFEGNFSTHDGNNLEATLDLQEVGTALLRPKVNGTTALPLPMLFSEYGSGYKVKPLPYSAAHDWWVMRGVTAKLMAFMSRPDKILRALPFITNKATWDKDGMANNASNSYPFVLWRNVTTAEAVKYFQQKEKRERKSHNVAHQVPPVTMQAISGLESAGEAGWVWLPTELHKWYAAWKDLDGDRFVVESDNSKNILVHGFAQQHPNGGQLAGDLERKVSATWQVVVYNLDFTDNVTNVMLSWPEDVVKKAKVDSWSLQQLRWDKTVGAPVITVTNGAATPAVPATGAHKRLVLPTTLTLSASELAIFTIHVTGKTVAPTKVAAEHTWYPDKFLEALASSSAAAIAAPYTFALGTAAPSSLKVRVGLGGNYSALHTALSALHIQVNGHECIVNPEQQMSNNIHVLPKDGSFFASLEVAASVLPATPSELANFTVTAWSESAGNLVVSTLVVITRVATSTLL